jgi:hypothetical protein
VKRSVYWAIAGLIASMALQVGAAWALIITVATAVIAAL